MNNITKLPSVAAKEWIDEKLSTDRGVDWARNYHRKQLLMIEEERKSGHHFTVLDGETCMSLKLGIDLEFEQALRALINRIDELEAQ